MVTFHDGPVAGTSLMIRRAPLFLRVVMGSDTIDALDQLDDEPQPGEIVHVYRRHGAAGAFCIRPGGCFATGEYHHVPDAPGEELRETSAWRAWVDKRAFEEGLTC